MFDIDFVWKLYYEWKWYCDVYSEWWINLEVVDICYLWWVIIFFVFKIEIKDGDYFLFLDFEVIVSVFDVYEIFFWVIFNF